MNLAPRKRYTPEFKAPAVELLTTGKPVAQVAEELCRSSNRLHSWRHTLRRENPLLRQANDILKKAAVIRGTRLPANSAT